jgi:hypothetical protein
MVHPTPHDSAAKAASDFLLDLAHGKYDAEIDTAKAVLAAIPAPWAVVVGQAMNVLLMINKATAPLSVVPDGRGGFVPEHGQSIIDPKTGRFTGGKS